MKRAPGHIPCSLPIPTVPCILIPKRIGLCTSCVLPDSGQWSIIQLHNTTDVCVQSRYHRVYFYITYMGHMSGLGAIMLLCFGQHLWSHDNIEHLLSSHTVNNLGLCSQCHIRGGAIDTQGCGGGAIGIFFLSKLFFPFPRPNNNLFPLWIRTRYFFHPRAWNIPSVCWTFYFFHEWWEQTFSALSAEQTFLGGMKKQKTKHSPPPGCPMVRP